MNKKFYKRTSREMPQYVKDKIRATMTGRRLSQETKNKISRGQKNAWAKIPYRGGDNNEINKQNNDETIV